MIYCLKLLLAFWKSIKVNLNHKKREADMNSHKTNCSGIIQEERSFQKWKAFDGSPTNVKPPKLLEKSALYRRILIKTKRKRNEFDKGFRARFRYGVNICAKQSPILQSKELWEKPLLSKQKRKPVWKDENIHCAMSK